MSTVPDRDRFDHYMREHITDAQIEDADFLMKNGATFEQAAERLGMTKRALEKAYGRREKQSERHRSEK